MLQKQMERCTWVAEKKSDTKIMSKFKNKFVDYKSKRKIAVNQKSKMLREYSKLCKREGIQSERVNMNEEISEIAEKIRKPKPKKENKYDPYEAYRLGKERKSIDATKLQSEQQKTKEIIKDIELKKKEQKKKILKRTKRGQPILNDQIQNMLEKIKQKKNT